MLFARGVLVFFGLSYLLFGVWALLAPQGFARLIGFTLQTPVAITELRSFYGGLEIGLAAFLLLSTVDRQAALAGLAVLSIATGGIVLARLIGLFVDGSASQFIFIALGWEVSAVALGAWAWTALRAA